MEREEIEQLCNTGELEVVTTDETIMLGGNNKCGKVTRDGTDYLDLLELLLIERMRMSRWRRTDGVLPGVDKFFPAISDIYVCNQYTTSIYTENSGRLSVNCGFGLYYSRTNYTIEEDEDYFYVSTCYDLYLDNRIMNSDQNIVSRLMRSQNMNELPGSLRSQEPTTEILDRVGQRICARSLAREEGSRPMSTNRRSLRYYPAEREEIRQHMLQNILPGMKEHLTNTDRTEIDFVPNALRACTAFAKNTTYVVDMDEVAETQIEYDWLMRGKLQRKMQEIDIVSERYRDGEEPSIRLLSYTLDEAKATVLMDGGHHKKHEYMITKVRPAGWNYPAYAQLLCTSKTAGNLKEMLKESIDNGITDFFCSIYNIEPKNLMSEQANLSYYEEETRASLDRLVGQDLTLVRTGSADGYKSPKGDTLQDICQFNGDLYTAIVDRPMRLRRGDLSIDLGEGLYVVCVDHGTELDFLQYTRVTDYFSDVRIEEVHSRLTIDQEVYRAAAVEVHEGRDLILDQGEKAEKHLSSYRIARGDLDLGDH